MVGIQLVPSSDIVGKKKTTEWQEIKEEVPVVVGMEGYEIQCGTQAFAIISQNYELWKPRFSQRIDKWPKLTTNEPNDFGS